MTEPDVSPAASQFVACWRIAASNGGAGIGGPPLTLGGDSGKSTGPLLGATGTSTDTSLFVISALPKRHVALSSSVRHLLRAPKGPRGKDDHRPAVHPSSGPGAR